MRRESLYQLARLISYLSGPSEINTRRGLNAVHKNFDKVTRKLEEAYNHFLSDDRITAGIVGIYTQMCADAKLKDKLIKERGEFFLRKYLCAVTFVLNQLYRPHFENIHPYQASRGLS